LAGTGNIFRGNLLAAFLNFASDCQQRFQLFGDRCRLKVQLHVMDQSLISAQAVGRDGTVGALAKMATVLRGNVSGDHFSLGWRQSIRSAKQHFCQGVKRLSGFRAEGHGP
jgi:hypothetical protein